MIHAHRGPAPRRAQWVAAAALSAGAIAFAARSPAADAPRTAPAPQPSPATTAAGAAPTPAGTPEDLARVDRLEDLLLRVTPQVDDLDAAVLDLALPDATARRQFLPEVNVVDLAPADAAVLLTPPADALTVTRDWPVEAAPRMAETATLRLWRPVLDQVDWLRNAHFKIVRGRFANPDESQWVADVRFDAVARL